MSDETYGRGYEKEPYVRSVTGDLFGPFTIPEEDVKDYRRGRKHRTEDDLREEHRRENS